MAQYSFERLRPEYTSLWTGMTITRPVAAQAAARRIVATTNRYKEAEQATNVPWFVIGALHMRESDANFSTSLGNGEPLNRVTRLVPRGRGPFSSWQQGAIDALRLDGLHKVTQWT